MIVMKREMEVNKEEFFAFLEKRKNSTMKEALNLVKEERKDDSNTLKAKANIYDIIKAFWNAEEKKTEDKKVFLENLLEKIAMLQATWTTSLELAKQHNDVAKIVIEEAKLSAVDEIVNTLTATRV